jgi:RNA polymerase sigma-70 factor (ECF subfamily)
MAQEPGSPDLREELSRALVDHGDRLSRSPSWSRPPDEILLGAEAVAALDRAVRELTPMQRMVFEMREVEGRTSDEVAEILDIPAGTVRVHLHRARLRLRALLSEHFRKAPA